MNKQTIPDTKLVFTHAAKTLQLTDFTAVYAERLMFVYDVTNGALIYGAGGAAYVNAAVPPTSATVTASGNTFTFSALPSGPTFADTDKLAVVYDCLSTDPTYDALPVAVSGAVLFEGNDGANSHNVYADSAGNLHTVDQTPAYAVARSNLSIPVGTSSTLVLNDSAGARKKVILSNGTGVAVWVSFSAGPAVVGQSIGLPANSPPWGEYYSGPVYAIAAAATSGNLGVTEL